MSNRQSLRKLTRRNGLQKRRLKEAYFSRVHRLTIYNRDAMSNSVMCGCMCCRRIFPVGEVEDWADCGTTAVCPYCSTDALIPDGSGIEVTESLIDIMNKRFF